MLREIALADLTLHPFTALDKDWALLSAGDSSRFNGMTVSWGMLGTLWSLPVAEVFARPSRYTREFLESSGYYTLSFFDESYKKTLGYMGSASGRDEDKVAKSGLTPAFDAATGAPYYEEARLVLVCRKIYTEDFKAEKFLDKALIGKCYPDADFHRLYVGEVLKVLSAQ